MVRPYYQYNRRREQNGDEDDAEYADGHRSCTSGCVFHKRLSKHPDDEE